MLGKVRLACCITVVLMLAGCACAQGRRQASPATPRLGVMVVDTAPDAEVKGALVQQVAAGSAAAAAGVQVGDVILELGGFKITSAATLSRLLARLRISGHDLKITVARGGETLVLHNSNGQAGPPSGPQLGIEVSDIPGDWNTQGVLIGHVAFGSPADDVGIRQGDVVLSLDDKKVAASADLVKAVAELRAGVPCELKLRRGSQELVVLAVPRDPADSAAQSANSARRPLSEINVLKYAVIDPNSRAVTFIGAYDPAYRTGGIAYYDLLKDALAGPYPWFSLEPTQETRQAIKTAHAAIGSDVQRMYSDPTYCDTWANKLLDLLLNDPFLARDGQRFISKGAEAFQITEDEMRMVLAASSGDSSVTSAEMMPITAKVLRRLGLGDVADAMVASSGEDDHMKGFELMGLKSESEEILAKYHSGALTYDQAYIELDTRFQSALLRRLKTPESEITSRVQRVYNGQMSVEELQQYTMDRFSEFIVDGVGLKMFHGLTLSHNVLGKLYGVPTPQVELVFDGVSPDSLLGDVLFRADYALKTICTSPDIKKSIPGFLTEIEYIYESSLRSGTRVPGDAGAEIGHRLVPGEVRMSVSEDGSVVSFDEARVKIIGWMEKATGSQCSTDVQDTIRSAVSEHAGYVTDNYDALAAVFPELHRIREAEKVIALARWAKTRGCALTVGRATGIRLVQPPTAVGFWMASFTADAEELSLSVVSEGGASFGEDEGEQWVKPTSDPAVAPRVADQLAASAALADQAAGMAASGDLESARELAEKSAQAMTGQLDLAALNSLPEPSQALPVPQAAELSTEALCAIDSNLQQMEHAEAAVTAISGQTGLSAQEAAQIRETAEAQKKQAQANLAVVNTALQDVGHDPGKIEQALAQIRDLGSVPSPTVTAAGPQPAGGTVSSGDSTPRPAEEPILSGEMTPEQRQKALAELAELEKELDATKSQFARLTKSIMQDQKQFDDWQKTASDGMDKCSGVLYGLLMDASAGQLASRYEKMHEIAQKLPDNPQDLIDNLGRVKNWFKALGYTQTYKDVEDLAAKDARTLPELLEGVRDGINIIAGVTGLDKTVVGGAWKYGCSVVDMAYSFAQYTTAYDRIEQLDKNSDSYLQAVASLSERTKTLVTRINEIKTELGTASR